MRNAVLLSAMFAVSAVTPAQVTVSRPRVQVAVVPVQVQVAVPPGEVVAQTKVARVAVAWPGFQVAAAWPPQKWEFDDLLGPHSGSFLGVGVEEVDSARAKELKLKDEHGVEIRRVDPDSAAEKAGLKEHDVVLEYNGQRVEGVEQFTRMVRETPVGRAVKLLISRDGNNQTLTATLGRRKEATARAWSFAVPNPPAPPMIDVPRPMIMTRTTRIGVETEAVSGQLAEFFGVKEGVLVRSVDRDSIAEKAGVKTGDVITKIDGNRVRQARDLSEELRSAGDRKTIPLTVVRNKKEMTLNLELPERSSDTHRGVRVLRHEQL